MIRRHHIIVAAVLVFLGAASIRAEAIPAFARKYHTSCETCHTVFPKLTPFGEAFRRNGYRFPGVDSDFVKMEPVPLGQDAWKQLFPNAVWPSTLPPAAPLALGFNGSASVHPQAGGPRFTTADLVEEAHLWAGGSFDDKITFFTELTAAEGGLELEHATLQFGDLIGPAHLINLTVGKGASTLSSYGPHSTYVADMAMPLVPVTGLYGAQSDSFNLVDNYPGVELNGTAEGRFDYALGLSAGADADPGNTRDLHAHVGYKFGGLRLDGEDAGDNAPDPDAEHSLTVDAFWVRALSNYVDGSGASQDDIATAYGGSVRGQWGKGEIDAGAYAQNDSHAVVGGDKVDTFAQWDELSWRAYPWLVGAARVEYIHLSHPGVDAVSDLRIVPGLAALVRPNLKLTVTAPLERAQGAPDGGWDPSERSAAPVTPTATRGTEVESVDLTLWTAF